MKSTPADNELKEEHLLNFVVNSLGDDLPIELGENVEVTTEKLYEVLAGASEPVGVGPLRLISTQTHLAGSYVSDTADAVSLFSLIRQLQLTGINNLLQKSVQLNSSGTKPLQWQIVNAMNIKDGAFLEDSQWAYHSECYSTITSFG